MTFAVVPASALALPSSAVPNALQIRAHADSITTLVKLGRAYDRLGIEVCLAG